MVFEMRLEAYNFQNNLALLKQWMSCINCGPYELWVKGRKGEEKNTQPINPVGHEKNIENGNSRNFLMHVH